MKKNEIFNGLLKRQIFLAFLVFILALLYFDFPLVNAQQREKDYEPIITKYTHEISENPDQAQLYLARGCVYEDSRQYDLAINDYNKSIQLENSKDHIYNMYLLRRVMGYIMWSGGADDKFIARYTQEIALNNQDISAYKNRGALYHIMGKKELAIADYNQALEMEPCDIFIYELRAMVYMSQLKFDLAIRDYTKILENKPQYFLIYKARASAYTANREYKLAAADYSQYIRSFNPSDTTVYEERAAVYRMLKETDLAIADYSKMIALDSNDYKTYLLRADEYKYKNLKEMAKNDYNKAVQLHPTLETYKIRGKFLEDNNEYGQAIADYSRVLDLNPEDIYYFFIRGELYRKIGEYDLAITDFDKVIEANPKFKEAYEKRDLCYYGKKTK